MFSLPCRGGRASSHGTNPASAPLLLPRGVQRSRPRITTIVPSMNSRLLCCCSRVSRRMVGVETWKSCELFLFFHLSRACSAPPLRARPRCWCCSLRPPHPNTRPPTWPRKTLTGRRRCSRHQVWGETCRRGPEELGAWPQQPSPPHWRDRCACVWAHVSGRTAAAVCCVGVSAVEHARPPRAFFWLECYDAWSRESDAPCLLPALHLYRHCHILRTWELINSG